MNKVQAAIAKAREAREKLGAEASTGTQLPRGRQRVADAHAQATSGKLQATTRQAAWQSLSTFTPSAKRMAQQRIVTFDAAAKPTPGIVAFDMLRTKVLQQMRKHGWKRLAITSPGVDCGKTTVALNLAFSLSRQPETHILVADMDMRRPAIARTFALEQGTNFRKVLEGQALFADAAMRGRPNLAFGLNYTPSRNPSELLQSSQVGQVLTAIEKQYAPDLMIFDMPPMLLSDDTMGFMGQVDCVLLIAAAESTSIREVDVCERDLASQTNVMGVLLNKCRYIDNEAGGVATYD